MAINIIAAGTSKHAHNEKGQTEMITMHYTEGQSHTHKKCRVMAKLELDKHSIAFFHRNHTFYKEIQLCALLYVHVPLILLKKCGIKLINIHMLKLCN